MRDLRRIAGAGLGLPALVALLITSGCADRSATRPPDRVSLLPVPRDVPRVHVRGSFSPPRRNPGGVFVSPVVPMTPMAPEVVPAPAPAVGLGGPTPAFPE